MEKEREEVWYKYPNLLDKRECEDLISDMYKETGLVNSPERGDDTGLLEIEQFLVNEFGITSKDISPAWNTKTFNGRVFRINSEEKDLICEIRVAFLAKVGELDKHKVMFAAKVWIDYPEMGMQQYKSLCNDIKVKIKSLVLRRFTKDGRPCIEPTMFDIYDNISMDMFRLFMQGVQSFGEDFLLKYPADPGASFW